MLRKRYRLIGLGGTFDHLHEGHKHFIRYAADLGETLLIGVTKARLSSHKPYADAIENYSLRQAAVKQFCHAANIPAQVVPLTDPYGPTLEGTKVQALCVTPETTAGADKINIVRDKLGLRPLPVFVSDYVMAENGEPIHSAFIRAGIMDRQGLLYQTVLENDLTLTETQRKFFSQPQGPVVTESDPDALFTAVVGDTCLETFIKNGWSYDLGVYDLLSQRQAYSSAALEEISPEVTISNPAGVLTTALSKSLKGAIERHLEHLKVEGEEDLATVALVLLLPLRSMIYYGQRDVGMIQLEVTEKVKDEFWKILQG